MKDIVEAGGVINTEAVPLPEPDRNETVRNLSLEVLERELGRMREPSTAALQAAFETARAQTEGALVASGDLTKAEPENRLRGLLWTPDPDELGSAPPERPWLLRRPSQERDDVSEGFLPAGKVGMVVAGGGVGKTMVLVQLAVAVASNQPWLDTYTVARPGKVLLALAEEDRLEAQRRLYYAIDRTWESRDRDTVTKERAKRRQAVAANVRVLPLAGESVALVETNLQTKVTSRTPVLDHLAEVIREEGPFALVVLDPLSRFAGPDTETDNAAATRFIQAVESLLQVDEPPTILLAHHSTKASRKGDAPVDATASRGSSALTDGARWVLSMLPEAQDDGAPPLVAIELTKSNYGPLDRKRTLRREGHGTLRAETQAEANSRKEAKDGGRSRTSERPKTPARAKDPDA